MLKCKELYYGLSFKWGREYLSIWRGKKMLGRVRILPHYEELEDIYYSLRDNPKRLTAGFVDYVYSSLFLGICYDPNGYTWNH